MKQGLDIVELAQAIKDAEAAKKDFVGPTTQMTMTLSEPAAAEGQEQDMQPTPQPRFKLDGVDEPMTISNTAHGQIAQRLGIPTRYYRKMESEAPGLLAGNVNHWLHNRAEKRMVRTAGGHVRAFLSDRYRPLDNIALAEAVLPILHGHEDVKIESCALTADHLYLKATFPTIRFEARVGDVPQAGVSVANSETGKSRVVVRPQVLRLVCLNGATMDDHSLKTSHIGGRLGAGDGISELLTDETRQASDRAYWLTVRDVVKATMDKVAFETIARQWSEAAGHEIEAKVEKVVEVTAKQFNLTQGQGESVLDHLIKGGDMTQYGLANAITRTSQDMEGYEEATRLERIGGQIIELPKEDWRELAH